MCRPMWIGKRGARCTSMGSEQSLLLPMRGCGGVVKVPTDQTVSQKVPDGQSERCGCGVQGHGVCSQPEGTILCWLLVMVVQQRSLSGLHSCGTLRVRGRTVSVARCTAAVCVCVQRQALARRVISFCVQVLLPAPFGGSLICMQNLLRCGDSFWTWRPACTCTRL
jgi:hypothetical protein